MTFEEIYRDIEMGETFTFPGLDGNLTFSESGNLIYEHRGFSANLYCLKFLRRRDFQWVHRHSRCSTCNQILPKGWRPPILTFMSLVLAYYRYRFASCCFECGQRLRRRGNDVRDSQKRR